MIYLKNLKLKDFVSHKESDIDFGNNNSKISITGKSGSGKSSLVNAILFALYGDSKVDNASLIRKGAKTAQIILTIIVDEKEYVIEKNITKTGQKMSLHCNDEDITQATNKETQKYLEDNILKTSLALFKNSAFAMQDDSELFVHETPANRKDILMEIVNTYDFDELYNKTTEKIKENEKNLDIANAEIVQLNGLLSNLPNTIIDIETLRVQLNKKQENIINNKSKLDLAISNKSALSSKMEVLQFKNNELLDIDSKMKNIITKGTELKNLIGENENLDKDIITKGIEDVNNKLSSVQLLRSVYNEYSVNYKAWQSAKYALSNHKPNNIDYISKISQLEKRLVDTKNNPNLYCEFIGKICPRLESKLKEDVELIETELNASKTSKEMQDAQLKDWSEKMASIELQEPKYNGPDFVNIEEDFNKLMSRLNTLKSQVATLDKVNIWIKQKEDLVKSYNDLKEKSDSIKIEIESMNDLISQINDIDDNILNIKTSIKTLEDEVLSLSMNIQKQEEASKTKADLEQKVSIIKQSILDMKDNLSALETLKVAFGNNGIRTLILDDLLPTLEVYTNEILSELSDFRVKFDTQKTASKGDKVVEGLFITIVNDQGEELDFNSYSGGEQNKIIVSIQQALAKFSYFGFMIQDELIAGLDSESIDNFSKIMLHLKDKNMQVISISHLQEIKDLFEDQILVEKKNGISSVSRL